MEDARRLTALHLLLRQFESPLVLILVFGALVSLALRQWVDAGIILTIVLGSTLLGSPGFSFAGSSIFDWDSRRD